MWKHLRAGLRGTEVFCLRDSAVSAGSAVAPKEDHWRPNAYFFTEPVADALAPAKLFAEDFGFSSDLIW
ncbi:hypothetical protein Pan44_24150 [Caulifigura coniformis]|uniref:Uncharacterized protein n=1 Tax=Caulifigura coniformis TaxID=2527983 RepID=A0A517SE27_9PLAN|nr:hypothetical protein Pan44_24150 [Caulifigura coniformis]